MEFDSDAIISHVEELVEQRQWPALRDVLLPLPAAYIALILC